MVKQTSLRPDHRWDGQLAKFSGTKCIYLDDIFCKNFPIYAINFGNRSSSLFFQHEAIGKLNWPIRKMAILADTIINESLNLLADSSVWILNGFQRFHALVGGMVCALSVYWELRSMIYDGNCLHASCWLFSVVAPRVIVIEIFYRGKSLLDIGHKVS